MGLVRVQMPRLGESVTEGTVDRWLKAEGDHVKQDEPLVEVVTDKVNAEVASPFEGLLSRLLVAEGQTVPIGTTIAEMDVEGAVDESLEESTPPAASESHDQPGERRLTPMVRRLAADNGIDLDRVTGTGPGGRITRDDVEAFINASARDVAPTPGTPAQREIGPHDELLRIGGVRRQIAAHMVESAAIPHAWGMREVDMTRVVHYRDEHKESFRERYGVPLTYLALVIPIVCRALKANPLLNSSWHPDGIVLKHEINIGIAVARTDALVVPVIHHADELDTEQLARVVDDLKTRGRDGKLTPDDMQGGSFTLNNTGAFGGVAGMSIINSPQAAILNLESITRRPVVRGDDIVIRDIMNLTMSFDHRIMDGFAASRFTGMVQRDLERWAAADQHL